MPRTSPSPDPAFLPTRWSLVLAAGHWRAGTAQRRAMNDLARLYWFPLYAFLRRRGHTPANAEDLVQGFFTRLLDKDSLAAADPARGKFRSFLLAALAHFAANEFDKAHALKRSGGGAIDTFSLDMHAAESQYLADPADHLTPEKVFERRWALTVLDGVLARLRQDYASRNQLPLFNALEFVLTTGDKTRYDAIARELATTQGAIKVAAHRLRQRYRELLRDEIAQTVADPADIDGEIRHLLNSL